MITKERLLAILPAASRVPIDVYMPYINEAMGAAALTSPERSAMFLAQVGHESGSFRWLEELASGAAYEGRKDLGNTQPGDGIRFKGRGAIQLTGRKNYTAFAKWSGIDVVTTPALVAQPFLAFKSAAFFWVTNGLNAFADAKDIRGATKRINGGYNGLADREAIYGRACYQLGVRLSPSPFGK